MSIRVKYKVLLQNSEDKVGKNKLFYREDDVSQEVAIDGLDKQHSGNISVAVAATDTLSLGDLSDIRGLFLEVDADCTVRLNGSSDDILMKLPEGVTGGKAKLFIEATITAVAVENTGAAQLNGVYCIWGDPTP